MASYNDTFLTNNGIAILNRVLAGQCTVAFTRAVSSIADYSGKTLSELQALTSLDSIEQNGVATRFDVRSSTMVSIDLLFTNQDLQNSYEIKTIGLYAKASDSSTEVLYAIATASDPETMPAYVDQKLATFTLTLYTKVGQADKTSITITDEGVVKSVNGTIKPDANGNITMSYYSQAEVDQKVSSLQQKADSLTSTLSNGGINLLNDSNTFDWGITGWNFNPPHSIIDDDDSLKDCKIVLAAGVGNQGFWWPGNNTLNQTYTLSLDAKSDNGVAKFDKVGLENNFLMSNPPTISQGWMRYSVSGKVTAKNNSWVIYLSAPTADNVYIRRVQIEYGEIATPWQPSNVDFFTLQQTANTAKAEADANANSIQALSTQVNQNSSKITDAATAISRLDSKMTSPMPQAAYVPIQIGDKTDLNNMKTCGFYMLQGETINATLSG